MCQHRSQWTSTQKMHMNMIDFLAAMAITVHDQTVSVFSNPFLLSDFRGAGSEQAREELFELAKHTELTAIVCDDPLESDLPRAGTYAVTNGSERSELQAAAARLFHLHSGE